LSSGRVNNKTLIINKILKHLLTELKNIDKVITFEKITIFIFKGICI